MRRLNSPTDASDRRGFTLVELLVVIAIIAVLIALLMPAVQSAREAARNTECRNHLNQLAIAMHDFHDVHGQLPSDGWGTHWNGDANRNVGKDQPGNWAYSLLPYLEQTSLHQLVDDKKGKGSTANQKRVTTSLAVFNCPSRRSGLFPNASGRWAWNAGGPAMEAVARTDYAVNMGDFDLWPVMVQMLGRRGAGLKIRGPGTLAEGDKDTYEWPLPYPHTYDVTYTGVCFRRSEIKFRDVTDGTSSTYLIGEKYINPHHYDTGLDWGDNEDMYSGGNDSGRITLRPPAKDTNGVTRITIFGSAHPAGFNMAMCDGAVRTINYLINSDVHRWLGHRYDNETITNGAF